MKRFKKIFLLSVGALALGGVVLLAQYFLAGGRGREAQVSFSGRNLSLSTEIALTAKQHQQGLMGKRSMPQDRGMLFVFEEEEGLSFWMKDTLIPLDLVFISSDFKVVDIKEGFMPCLDGSACVPYQSAKPAKYVVEMNAGLATKNGLQLGDTVAIKLK